MVFIAVNAMTDDTTLNIDHNIYWTTKGAGAVTFLWDRARGKQASSPAFWALLSQVETYDGKMP